MSARTKRVISTEEIQFYHKPAKMLLTEKRRESAKNSKSVTLNTCTMKSTIQTSKHDGTNTVPSLYHFLPVCTGSTGYRSTVQNRYCFSISFHYWPVPFIRYWAIPFSYKYLIQRQNCTSVLVFPTRYILQWKLNFVYIVSNSNIIWCSEICLYSYRKYYINGIYIMYFIKLKNWEIGKWLVKTCE